MQDGRWRAVILPAALAQLDEAVHVASVQLASSKLRLHLMSVDFGSDMGSPRVPEAREHCMSRGASMIHLTVLRFQSVARVHSCPEPDHRLLCHCDTIVDCESGYLRHPSCNPLYILRNNIPR